MRAALTHPALKLPEQVSNWMLLYAMFLKLKE